VAADPDDERSGGTARRSQATRLAALADEVEFFHTPDREPYADVPIGGHRETLSLRGEEFRLWLRRRYHDEYGGAIGNQVVQDALGVLEGVALFEGPQRAVHTRIAALDGVTYLDLSNAAWEAVAIGPHGWTIVAEPPVRFRRSKGMLPLPHPEPGGGLDELRPFLNVASDEDWILIVAWLLGAFCPQGPYPLLALHGEQGSAKSTTARLLRSLIDPNTVPLRAEPRDTRDLAIAAQHSWLLTFDNLSNVPNWLSDALCRLSTGGGFATRALYSNDTEVLFEAQRPILLTGIADLATRSDLLERTIVCYLPSIPPDRRRTEAAVRADFAAARPRILGALLDVVSAALAARPTVTLPNLPRLADFALWATAAEPALGWPAGAFMQAFTSNRATIDELALEAAPIAIAVQQLAGRQAEWEGTATELLSALASHTDEATVRARDWPRRANALTAQLRRSAPNLRNLGVEIDLGRRKHGGRRQIRITTNAPKDRHPSSPSPGQHADLGPHGDDRPAMVTITGMGSSPSPPALTPLWQGRGGGGDDGDDGPDSAGRREVFEL